MKNDEIKKLLTVSSADTKKGKFGRLIYIGIFCSILLICGIMYAVGIRVEFTSEQLQQLRIVLISSVIGFVFSLLASSIYDLKIRKMIKNEDEGKIEKIKSIANEELILELFKDLKCYDNKYCEDYNIEAKLSKHQEDPNLLLMTTKYKYKKTLKSPYLKFKFVRITNEEENEQIESNKNVQNDYSNEYYSVFDERELTKEKEILTYDIEDVIVSSPGLSSDYLELKEVTKDNVISYNATISDDHLNNGPFVEIEYKVKFVISLESYYHFDFELPTKNMNISLDYSEVKDLISAYSIDFISSLESPKSLHKLDNTKIRLSHHSWLIPKSSILFIWYKKHIS